MTGSPIIFGVATMLVLAWLVGGIFVGFDNTLYQLLINTTTTIITFLLVFIVQNSQNRNAAALHIKLDEIIRALPEARTEIAASHIEDETDADIINERKHLEELITTPDQ